jgi:transposase
MKISLDALPDDPSALRDIILAQQQKIAGMEASSRAYEALIQALKLTIARLKRQRYGSSSEKIDREIAQLELALEGLEMAGSAADPAPEGDAPADAVATDTAATAQRLPPRRRGKPRIAADAPREVITLDPGAHCPDCGGVLRLVGEDVAEILDFIAAKLKVVEIHRPKKSCRDCERMVQTPAPSRPIPRGLAGPSLLAHILVTKFDDHVPLYRQGEIFARPPRPAGRVSFRDRMNGLLAIHGRRHSPLDTHRLVRPGRRCHPPGRQSDPRRGDGGRPAARRRHGCPHPFSNGCGIPTRRSACSTRR